MDTIVSVMNIAELPSREMLSILRQGSVLRLPHLEARLRQAQERLAHFEGTYQTTLDHLTTHGLPDDANYQFHEDFIEWEYWHDVNAETEVIIRNVKQILEEGVIVPSYEMSLDDVIFVLEQEMASENE